MQEAHNLAVPEAPRHVTTLARFAALRCLSLVGLGGLDQAKVSVQGMPASLTQCMSCPVRTQRDELSL